jgi:hypothetical protein
LKLSCYVYYRVLPEHIPEASAAARNMLEEMRNLTGVDARLMTKVGEPLLWMEVYEDIADQTAFLSAMRQCVERSHVERWLDGESARHTEIFQCA